MAAVQQIDRGSQQQASATQETSAALLQIENSGKLAQKTSSDSTERVSQMEAALKESRAAVARLVAGVDAALADTRTDDFAFGNGGPPHRKDCRRYRLNGGADEHARCEWVGRGRARRRRGTGFAVVSNDIRSLAREASQNVERAKDTVLGILDQIATLKRDFEQVAANAEIEV
jgi:methyl-accepting chemotaxis protein